MSLKNSTKVQKPKAAVNKTTGALKTERYAKDIQEILFVFHITMMCPRYFCCTALDQNKIEKSQHRFLKFRF
jgi:hypothetical protein